MAGLSKTTVSRFSIAEIREWLEDQRLVSDEGLEGTEENFALDGAINQLADPEDGIEAVTKRKAEG